MPHLGISAPSAEWHIGVIDAAEVGGFQTTSRLAHTLSAWEATGL